MSVASPQVLEESKPLDQQYVIGDIYNSYNKVKQEKDEESRKNLSEELKSKEAEINTYK